MQLNNLTLEQFVKTTASGEPVPGGGSISALCGSLSAALGSMVCNLTIGKKKYSDVQPLMINLANKLSEVSNLLLKAVELDSEAYDEVFQAYKLPKDNELAIEARNAAIQIALQHAASIPFSVCKLVNTFLPDLKEIAEKGNQNAITDCYVASLCARTAILGAAANSRINLTSITDESFVEEMTKDLSTIEQNVEKTEKEIASLLAKALE